MTEKKQLTAAELIETSFLSCTHCHQQFIAPTLLPCLHVFCSKCIQQLLQADTNNGQPKSSRSFQCPLCQEIVTMTEEWQPLHFMVTLCQLQTYKHQAERTCSYCEFEGRTKKATFLCLQCTDDLCEQCAMAHRKTRLTRTHVLAPYEQIKQGLYDHDIREAQPFLCSMHSLPLADFCEDCMQLVCKSCRSGEHNDHRCESSEAAVSKFKLQASSFVQGLQRQSLALGEHQAFLHSQLQMVKEREVTLRDTVLQQAEAIHALVTAHCSTMLELIEATFRKEQDAIQRHSDDLQVAKQSLNNNADFLQHLLALGSPCEVLQLSNAIMIRLKHLLRMEPMTRTQNFTAHFHPGPTTQQNMQIMFGDLNFYHVPLNKEEVESSGHLTIATLLPEPLNPAQLVDCIEAKLDDDAKEVWPSGLCVYRDLMVLVDRDNKKIKIFEHNSKVPKLKFQFSGMAEHKLVNPFDAVLLKNGVVVVTDYGAEKVKVFDVTGRWIGDICGDFRHPRGIAVTGKGQLVVVDSLLLQVTLHDMDSGQLLRTIPATDQSGNKLLVDPFYVTVMDDDKIIVTDHAAPNIKVFSVEGKHLATYGHYGTSASQVLKPFGICVDR